MPQGSRILLAIVLCFVARTVYAADLAGAADHPALPRVAGSEIIGHVSVPYDAATFLIKNEKDKLVPVQQEGARTRVLYLTKPGDVPLMVQKNYETALADLGEVTEIYSCRTDCRNHTLSTNLWTKDNLVQIPSITHAFYLLGFAHNYGNSTYRYARVITEDAQYHVGVLSAVIGDNNANKDVRGRTVALLDVVQTKKFEATLEFVDAAEIRTQIGASGYVTLYGIQFDHDKASLKAESDQTIDEIAKVLSADSALSLYVVGHTDDVGALAYNQDLSLRRAQSVVQRLQSLGIDAARLTPLGVGPAAPKASNENDDGRALNRRVELVKRQ